MLSAVCRRPVLMEEADFRATRNETRREQTDFIAALQKCDLEKVLEFLEKGNIDPFEVVEPSDELARQLFSINQKKHFIPYSEEAVVALKDFSHDCRMQAWMLISIFSDAAEKDNLKTLVFSKIKEIIGDDYEKKHSESSEEIRELMGSVDARSTSDPFSTSYQQKLEALAQEDNNFIIAMSKHEHKD